VAAGGAERAHNSPATRSGRPHLAGAGGGGQCSRHCSRDPAAGRQRRGQGWSGPRVGQQSAARRESIRPVDASWLCEFKFRFNLLGIGIAICESLSA